MRALEVSGVPLWAVQVNDRVVFSFLGDRRRLRATRVAPEKPRDSFWLRVPTFEARCLKDSPRGSVLTPVVSLSRCAPWAAKGFGVAVVSLGEPTWF
jgi:hypothetical protein